MGAGLGLILRPPSSWVLLGLLVLEQLSLPLVPLILEQELCLVRLGAVAPRVRVIALTLSTGKQADGLGVDALHRVVDDLLFLERHEGSLDALLGALLVRLVDRLRPEREHELLLGLQLLQLYVLLVDVLVLAE